ncbi:MAG: hypothetical protein A3F94_02380 [Candidatus Spechtbacteria bacterium RIFCSPLOWO2_12_FULL_38_22]|uniref:Uncharacterized protein n=1 Tax=Candidatus Spechtbacteria bacterium RIFCSPLOWO2_12_FULL_38_22 TaxID=1802165 RepID=A0A1G2HHT0_9BACT|nr:MAG: hypothetical protein A2728_03260 [Candidatus Spechtbacteria bacterium RIFCSPHIGHO2_01_FULL_38_11]OGZ59370.1 MAG: hypothetical protein A3A00_00460 [Candidatus Spechtbacteria bacterium RIFCSPLOWO2_01_FULL_38_20]OGZ59898.1 MAG: hypothetical protein A3E58_00555 [Candidatus Spechtbacteria bacterium RIFCSPHIGHO2_12_FULL_38_30]OGZ62054.1 MAG: hypothetical protein A3F94_02380 [Candidatus Spechtbacteria bacterium RIFCSPLOWO2_12_FULL_38_22]
MILTKKNRRLKKNFKHHNDKPRIFTIIRKEDESGVSGRGRVLDGVVFTDGKTVVNWRSDKPSIAVYGSFEEFKKIHIDSHPKNKTEIVWL